LAASSQDWNTKWDSGGNYGHTGGNNIFTNEPSILPAAATWGTLKRYYSGYVTIASSVPPGEYYVAVGDSITFGYNDDIPGDDTSLDGRNTGGGYEPILNNLLTAAKGVPHTVVNVGVNSATSANGAVWISTTLSNHPSAKYYLVMYGTNDARQFPAVPSGFGLKPGEAGYSGSYKDNMQTIISAILAAGKIPYVAKVPYAFDPGVDLLSIQNYNQVVDELIFDNDILVTPPDFYTYFQSNPGKLGADGIHPNGTGYQSMADLWFTALTTP
jgi:lysophospholipase L1-like esterase